MTSQSTAGESASVQEADSAVPRTGEPTASKSPLVSRRVIRLLGTVPFIAYASIFLLIPTGEIVVQAFRTPSGRFTLANVRGLFDSQILNAFETTIKISLITAVLGGILGLLVAQSALRDGGPGWIRPVLTTFAGVASNFAGIPLAFAFVATLGSTGVITELLNSAGLHIYSHGFTIYGMIGLSVTYMYFQFPLMVLIISPALEGIRREWKEAAINAGATSRQYWRMVGLPIILPSLLGAMVLLFGNAFSAYATPYALSGGYINIVPVLIGEAVNGDLAANPQLGASLAFGMIVVIAVAITIYAVLQRRAVRWLR